MVRSTATHESSHSLGASSFTASPPNRQPEIATALARHLRSLMESACSPRRRVDLGNSGVCGGEVSGPEPRDGGGAKGCRGERNESKLGESSAQFRSPTAASKARTINRHGRRNAFVCRVGSPNRVGCSRTAMERIAPRVFKVAVAKRDRCSKIKQFGVIGVWGSGLVRGEACRAGD